MSWVANLATNQRQLFLGNTQATRSQSQHITNTPFSLVSQLACTSPSAPSQYGLGAAHHTAATPVGSIAYVRKSMQSTERTEMLQEPLLTWCPAKAELSNGAGPRDCPCSQKVRWLLTRGSSSNWPSCFTTCKSCKSLPKYDLSANLIISHLEFRNSTILTSSPFSLSWPHWSLKRSYCKLLLHLL